MWEQSERSFLQVFLHNVLVIETPKMRFYFKDYLCLSKCLKSYM